MKKIIKLAVLFVLTFGALSPKVLASNYDLEAVRLYNLGLEQYKNGAYSASIDYFRAAIDIQNDFYDAYYNMAVVYDYIGDINSAISALEILLKNLPEDFAANYKLGQIYLKKGDFVKSAELLEKIPPTAQEFPKAQSLLSRIALENKIKKEENPTDVAAKVIPSVKSITGINAPSGIAQDSNGNVYVASYSDSAIFRVMPNNIHQLYSKNPLISGPIGIAFDSSDNMYVANYNKNNVLKIDKVGNVSVFIEQSSKPYCVFVKDDALYVGEQGSNVIVIRKL